LAWFTGASPGRLRQIARMVPRTLAALAVTCVLLTTGVVAAYAASVVRIPTHPVAHNPADHMDGKAMDRVRYDSATHCTGKTSKGVHALVHWLKKTRSRGVDWGSYRCEKWGKHSASLHAEGRAEDWHLDVTNTKDRHEAINLIRLFLAPDKRGRVHALATRMGIEELIWDCHYWGAGSPAFRKYSVCYDSHGHRRKHVDPTEAHRNHIHIGLTRAAAQLKTSYWRAHH
jgi:hypothetical protein